MSETLTFKTGQRVGWQVNAEDRPGKLLSATVLADGPDSNGMVRVHTEGDWGTTPTDISVPAGDLVPFR